MILISFKMYTKIIKETEKIKSDVCSLILLLRHDFLRRDAFFVI